MLVNDKQQKKKLQRPGEQIANKRSTSKYDSKVENDEEIEEYIKTVEDDVLENKYSSSFDGDEPVQAIKSGQGSIRQRPGSSVVRGGSSMSESIEDEILSGEGDTNGVI